MSLKSAVYKSSVQLLSNSINILLLLVPPKRRERVLVDLYNALGMYKTVLISSGKKLSFFCPTHDAVFRAAEFLNKEPETLEWIDSFSEEEILWDIGANIGSYTLYAAKNRQMNVLAFEPSFANFWLLNENIKLNNLGNKIAGYCLAISKESFLGTFNMGDTNAGGALYHFGAAVNSFNYPGVGETKVQFKQGMLGVSIDELVSIYKLSVPSHIKIDVDGLEGDIIKGAAATLRNPRLKSLLVELDESDPSSKEILNSLKSAGFTYKAYKSYDKNATQIKNYIFQRIV